MAWLVPRAHGTPTMKLWSFDVRSRGPSQATLMGGGLSELGEEMEVNGRAFFARRTRTIRMCSFDARNGDHTSCLNECE